MARYRLNPLAIRETTTTALPVSGATVTVYLAGTSTLATCYANTTTATALTGSQTTTTASGYFEFFIDGADYRATQRFKIVITKTSYPDVTYDYLSVITLSETELDLREFLPVGFVTDGSIDYSTEIQTCITTGGRIFAPAGTWLMNDTGSSVALVMSSNTLLRGAGIGSTILKLADSANAHLITITSKSNIGMFDLTIDGNRANQTSTVHAIRVAGVEDFYTGNIEIKNAAHYGIGIQDGTNKRVHLKQLYIHDTGGDGIDVKNKNDDNETLFIDGITVLNFGLNGALTVQAGIDLRGPCNVSNVWVAGPPADGMGVRFRQGELLDVNGYGAHRSNLSNFDIRMGAAASGIGVNVVARDVKIINGYVNGGFRGVLVQDDRCKVTNVTVEGVSDDAFFADATATPGLEGHSATFMNCTAIGNTDAGFVSECSNVQFIGCSSIDNDDGFRIEAAATGNKILGGLVSGNVTAVSDAGTSTVIRNLEGYVTEANLISSDLTIDSTGTKTFTISHGLGTTPNIEDCTLTVLRNTNVGDHRVGLSQIDSVTSTEVLGRIVITTASATGGAVCNAGVLIRSK